MSLCLDQIYGNKTNEEVRFSVRSLFFISKKKIFTPAMVKTLNPLYGIIVISFCIVILKIKFSFKG